MSTDERHRLALVEEVAALRAEVEALRADAELLRIRGEAYEAAYRHWGSTMRGGLDCAECVKAREECNSVLREWLQRFEAVAKEQR